MSFHPEFKDVVLGSGDTPNWFGARSRVYNNVANWKGKSIDEVFFDFSAPDCGRIDVSVYVNGNKAHEFPLTAESFEPLIGMRKWMEDIVNDLKLSADLYLEMDGRTVILHYEHIRLAQVLIRYSGEKFDANDGAPDIGLFYMYDSAKDDIPVVCCCRTKDFLSALYNGLMWYASRSENAPLIEDEWYNMGNEYEKTSRDDNWTFYNTLKSPLIEWNLDSPFAYRHGAPSFKAVPKIKETVHMWVEWGDGLFWDQQGRCCGNAEEFEIDTEPTRVNLRDIPEIREWYDEFDAGDPLAEWTEEQFKSWHKKGWELSKKVRAKLPAEVDLFYEWKSFRRTEPQLGYTEIGILVPDERLLVPKDIR
jgi:hypothetical protein